jgi:hypothetical protein
VANAMAIIGQSALTIGARVVTDLPTARHLLRKWLQASMKKAEEFDASIIRKEVIRVLRDS